MKAEQIQTLLPAVVQAAVRTNTPLSALLYLMQELHEPDECILDRIADYLNPAITPDSFLPFLAQWVDIDRFFPADYILSSGTTPLSSGSGQLRQLVLTAAQLSKWRGTPAGLIRILETATGCRGFILDESPRKTDGTIQPFHIQIAAPASAYTHRALIERIIEQEKPAYVTCRLSFQDT